MKSYEEVLEELYNKFPLFQKYGQSAYKPGLERILEMAKAFGQPQNKFKSIHIAGTNGKGSTAHILASVYQHKDLKVGVYSSPHLLDFRERIKINGEYISQNQVVEYYNEIIEKLNDLSPSFFEVTTLMAFMHFADQQVDLAIIETGLGGRLDATNIVQPLVSVITPISMEHEAYLGDTIEKIAKEKGGIIKKNTPAVISHQNDAVKKVFEDIAEENISPLSYSSNDKNWVTDLKADYQQNNIQLSYAVVQTLQNHWTISDLHFEKTIQSVRTTANFLGRFMQLQESPIVIADAGHNTAGLIATWDSFSKSYEEKDKMLVIGCSNDKKIESFFEHIPSGPKIILTSYNQPRAMKVEDLHKQTGIHQKNCVLIENAQKAIEYANRITNQEDAILVTGSVFLIGEIFPIFSKK